MRIFIFGVGQFFRNRKKQFWEISADDTIIGFLDNRADEVSEYEGLPVFPPAIVSEEKFDCIVLMSTYHQEICEQLIGLGVSKDKILFWEQYRAEKTCGRIYLQFSALPQNSKSVLVISTDLVYNGGSIAALHAVLALVSRGYNVCLAVPSCDPRFYIEIMAYKINLLICPVLPYVTDLEKIGIEKFDVVIVNVFQMIKTACEISRYRPVLWWIHESDWGQDSVYRYIRYQFSSYDNIQAMKKIGIYAVSDIARQAFETYYPHQVRDVLPYGIPDEASSAVSHNAQNDKFVFAIIGSVCRLKAQLIFLEAAGMLPEEIREACEFWIIGSYGQDSYGKQTQEVADSIPQAKIMGELTRHELKDAFEKIDCVVCTSFSETMSLAITEGMMHGKICITTNRTGMAEYIRNGVDGFICEAENVVSLYRCMKEVFDLKDKSENLRKNARKLYENEFSMERFGERLEQALLDTEMRYYGAQI